MACYYKSKSYYNSLLLEMIKKDDLSNFINILREEQSESNNFDRKLTEKLNIKKNTILHEAIYWSSSNILQFILKNNNECIIKLQNIDKNNILNLATLKQLDWVVNNIIDLYRDEDIYSSHNNNGDTPFLSAIRTGSITLVNLYLNNEYTHTNITQINDNTNNNSLHIAVTTPNKNFKIIKLLIEKYKNDNELDTKSYLIGIPQNLHNDTTSSIYSNVTPSNKFKTSILQDLNKQPKNSLNLQIETYIIRELYRSYHGSEVELKDILTKYPEYAAYEKCSNNSFNIPISYEEDVNDTYGNTNQNPMKILPKRLKNSFQKN